MQTILDFFILIIIHNPQHEEADTLIPMHVMDGSKTDGDIRYIDVYSPIQIYLFF